MIARFLLQIAIIAVLALFGVCELASCTAPGNPLNGTLTIYSSTAISDCSNFNGSIEIASNYTGVLDFGSLVGIYGNVLISNVPALAEVHGEHLTTLAGSLDITNCTDLTNVTLGNLSNLSHGWVMAPPLNIGLGLLVRENPRLQVLNLGQLGDPYYINVTAEISLDLPNLQYITGGLYLNGVTGLSAPALDKAMSINISSSSMTEINFPALSQASSINISSSSMTEINFPKLSSSFDISIADNPLLTSILFPELEFAGSTLTIGNNSHLETVDVSNINTLIYGLNISHNGRLLELNVPSLLGIGSSSFAETSDLNQKLLFNIESNANLTNVSMPILQTVGMYFAALANPWDIVVENNPQLQILDAFPMLKFVNGSVNISGDFRSISFPALTNVTGSFNVNSSLPIAASCSTFEDLKHRGIIEGNMTCSSPPIPPTSPSPASPTSNITKQTSLSTGAKAGIGTGASIFGLLFIIGGAFFIVKCKQRWSAFPKDGAVDVPIAELPAGKVGHELEAKHGHGELGPGQVEVFEMPVPPPNSHT